jgi:hypothetical protein
MMFKIAQTPFNFVSKMIDRSLYSKYLGQLL